MSHLTPLLSGSLILDNRNVHVSGSAYKIVKDRAYHHGTMLISTQLDTLGELLRANKVRTRVALSQSPRGLTQVQHCAGHDGNARCRVGAVAGVQLAAAVQRRGP